MDRQAAWDLLCEHTKGEGLRKHGLAVEAVMRHFARKHGEREETWAVVGLLHDFDYEQHPTAAEHPFVGVGILRERGYPEEVVLAVLGHAEAPRSWAWTWTRTSPS
jgi:putative nucleotidyltransferase with HDIG domain